MIKYVEDKEGVRLPMAHSVQKAVSSGMKSNKNPPRKFLKLRVNSLER